MRERSKVLKKILKVLRSIEGRELEEEIIEIRLLDGSTVKLKILVEKKMGLKLIKPS